MSKRRKKGFNAERELVKKFKQKGIWATRIPVSGIRQPLPDVLVAYRGMLHGFEVKSVMKAQRMYKKSFDNTIYWLNAMTQESLRACAWLAVKFKGNKWRFYKLTNEIEKIDISPNNGYTFTQLLKILNQSNDEGSVSRET